MGDQEDEAYESHQPPALAHQSASVILNERTSEVRAGGASTPFNANQRRDSLEDTRNFYGLESTSPPAGPSHATVSSRVSNKKVRSHVRPSSSGTSSLPKSPPRSGVPLPTPRGFLAPKKPAAAVRLEQKERGRAVQERSSLSQEQHATTAPSSKIIHRLNGEADETIDPLGDDVTLASRSPRDQTPESTWNRSTCQSVTGASTPLHTAPPDHSLEHLVNGKGFEKPIGRISPSKFPRDAQTAKRRRKYTILENPQTTWFCGGHLMTGGDSLVSVGMSVTVLLGLSGVWLGTTGVWLWVHGKEYGLAKGGGVAIVIIFVSMLVAALRDPGIIPRNLDPDPPTSQIDSWWEALPREIVVKDDRVSVKYCETCKTYRPPRSSHCRLCGNCVDGIDHHCSYIHTCVGKRNYLSFIVLIVTSAIASIYIVVFSAIHFSLLCHHDHVSFPQALRDSPGAAVSFLLGVIVLPAIFFLLYYHLRLLLWNLTTVEQIRASASSNLLLAHKRPDNPFAADSLLSNLLIASLGRPQFSSWIGASKWYDESVLEINPALTDPKWAKQGVY